MEAMLGISLQSYLYLKLIPYIFSLTKLGKRSEQVLPRNEGEECRESDGPNNVYTCE
jgi:hypothetical protein